MQQMTTISIKQLNIGPNNLPNERKCRKGERKRQIEWALAEDADAVAVVEAEVEQKLKLKLMMIMMNDCIF